MNKRASFSTRRKHLRAVVVIITVGTIVLGFINTARLLRPVQVSLSNISTITNTDAYSPPTYLYPNSTNNEHHASSTTTRTASYKFFWEKEESTCFHLDHVCHSAKDGWFYAPAISSTEFSNNQKKPKQPTATLLGTTKDTEMMLPHDNLNGFDVDDRIQFHILNNSTHIYDNYNNTCTFDPTPNHLIAQSVYNEMMGEFYIRTLMGLNRWIHDDYDHLHSPPSSSLNNSNIDIQIYIHFVEKYNLFEGHQLFLGGIPNNNHFESFLSLMPSTFNTTNNDDVDADGTSLSSSCRCFTKLIFCGYYMENSTTILSDNVTKIFGGHKAANSPEFKHNVRRKFDPNFNGHEQAIGFKPHSLIDNPATSWSIAGDNFAFRDVRNDLFVMHSLRFANLDEKIRQYKMNTLVEMGLLGSNSNNNSTIDDTAAAAAAATADEWKLIGFARRKSRRLWLNINDIMSMCSEKFQQQYQVACIIVDVEEATSPEEQLIMHRSLFALIGVHGAQLTQGLLLPSHGNILEILPWIPSYSIGVWVASTSAPTPLGVLYHNTDINHYGYALGRNSTPLCSHVSIHDEDATKECLLNDEDGTSQNFQWDVRDFTVPVHAIEDFLSLIILQQYHNDSIEDGHKSETTEGVTTCDDMRIGAKEGNFVLYNAYCRQYVNESSFVTEHYYHEGE